MTDPTSSDLYDEAVRRYHHDAEFHNEVNLAVGLAFHGHTNGPINRGDCLHAVAVALAVRDAHSGRDGER